MFPLSMNGFALSIVLMYNLYAVTTSYSYNNQDNWPELCQNGVRQSPMNISTSEAVFSDKSFTVIDYNTAYNAELKVEGEHVFIANFNDADRRKRIPTFQVHVTNSEHFDYLLRKIGFHLSSKDETHGCEHIVDGDCEALEIHFEHVPRFAPSSEAARHVFYSARFQVTNRTSRELDKSLYKAVKALVEERRHDPIASESFSFNPSTLMGTQGKAFFYYGSLSFPNPDCTENVVWVIQKEAMYISKEELAQIRNLLGSTSSNSRKIKHNESDSATNSKTTRQLMAVNFQYLLQEESALDKDVRVNVLIGALFYSSKYLFILTLVVLFVYYLTY